MTADMALWLGGVVMEAAVVGLLLSRRVFREYTMFFIYVVWTFASDVIGIFIESRSPSHFMQWFVGETSLDSLLQFAVLVELAWSILRPFRASLPRWTIPALAVLIAVVGAAIWPFASVPKFAGLPAQWHFLVRLQQTDSILRVLFFLLLAGSSQLLAIGWRNRELQIATGLGFYSLVSLGAAVLHKHQSNSQQYHLVDRFVVVAYLGSLAYWVFSFAQQEAVRQEFSPKMQTLLLSLAGSTRSARLSIEDSGRADRGKHQNH